MGSYSPSCSGSRFPLALPFSQTYPLCCVDIRSFTEQYYQFAEGFAEHHRDIDDVLRKVCFLVVYFLESFFDEGADRDPHFPRSR